MPRHLRWAGGRERARVARRVLAVLGAAPAGGSAAGATREIGAVPTLGLPAGTGTRAPFGAASATGVRTAFGTAPATGVRPGGGLAPAPDALSGFRIDPGRRPAWALGAVAVLAVVLTGWWVLRGQPQTDAVVASAVARSSATSAQSSAVASRSGSSGGAITASGSTAPVVVDVVGKVARPGVYTLAGGSRVHDALRRAGGALPGVDLTAINLARKVADGEQIAVGVAGSTASTGSGLVVGSEASGSGAAAGSPVDLNTASIAQLDGLPGVGPVLAQHILDWRAAHGRFDSVDQLRDVSGIGPSKYASLRPLVTV